MKTKIPFYDLSILADDRQARGCWTTRIPSDILVALCDVVEAALWLKHFPQIPNPGQTPEAALADLYDVLEQFG